MTQFDPNKVVLHPRTFPDNTKPKGSLSRDAASQACWFYYTIAESASCIIGDSTEHQIILEGQDWMDKQYLQQARSTAMMYGVTVEDMFKRWPEVIEEAKACGLNEPREEYMNPKRFIH